LSDAETVAKFARLSGSRLNPDMVGSMVDKVMALETFPEANVLNGPLQTTNEPVPIR
jgi:hypothetical protein